MKKSLAAAAAVLAALMLGGCENGSLYSDMREIDQLELIQTIGLDAEKNGYITATAASGLNLGSGSHTVLENTSRTVARALREMQNYTSKKYIFYSHTKYLLIGEDAAREGLGRYLDYVERAVDVRLNTGLIIVRGGTANELIKQTSSDDESTGELLESLDKDTRLMSESSVSTCGEVAERLAETGSALAAAVILEQDEEGEYRISSAGYAIIKEGALAGYIDTNLSRAVNLLTNAVEGDVTEVPDGNGGYAALRITGGDSSFNAEFSDGRPASIRIDAKINANIEELSGRLDIYDGSVTDCLAAELARLEAERIRGVLEISRELECDFLDIGGRIRTKHPIAYDSIAEDWAGCLAQSEISVSVDARIERTYDIGIPLEDDGEENAE